MRVLAADIGGTTTRVCMAECDGGACRALRTQHYASAQYAGLSAILREFLRHENPATIDSACIAVAGPVRATAGGQQARVTNLPWELDSAALAHAFGLARLRLINDFEAVGYGLEALGEHERVALQPGDAPAHAPRAVIGAGTGLGQAILVWQGEGYTVLPTEGGHADFGPTDALQFDLARWLHARHGHASYEQVLSGPGLARLYEFLRERIATPESLTLHDDAAAAVTQAAFERGDPVARAAVQLFARIYGAQAGNLALTVGATGGVYVAGGIAPRVLPAFAGDFLAAFRNKGSMSAYVAAIPVWLVTNPQVGLLGAMHTAARG